MNATSTSVRAPTQLALTIGALGVVFGDIGTSPLYTLNETLGYAAAAVRKEAILGSLSLMFWSLTFAVCFKYLGFVMRADNRGEGGIFALLALGTKGSAASPHRVRAFAVLILFGAALLCGEGVITPAISVLGATEGLVTLHHGFEPFVPMITAVILAILFSVQHRGSHVLGRAFGPVMAIWFSVIALFGLWHVAHVPEVLAALNPWRGIRMLLEHPSRIAMVLGAVTLTITGTEALYADMGHFGRRAITRAWYGAAFPGLVLSYFGQGAYALRHLDERINPFFGQAPDGPLRWLLIALSTAAAVIASQALISGTYSLTRQAIQLGFFPRLHVQHTSAALAGQIYLPLVNAFLAVLSITIVFLFGSVTRLAAAYGIAVTGTMVITTLAFYRVARLRWNWSRLRALPLCALFLSFDATFFVANLHKFPDGGWLPFLLGAALLTTMYTWKTGRAEIHQRVYGNNVTEAELVDIASSEYLTRVNGVAVFMMGSPTGAPMALLHHVKSARSLQNTVILLSILTRDVPNVAAEERLELREIGEGIWRAIAQYGYMESPDATVLLHLIRERGIAINPDAATYYFNREMIIPSGDSRMWGWQKRFYGFLSRNARPARDYFNIPPAQIIEIGMPVQL